MIRSSHQDEASVGKRCRYRDTILPACMMLWHRKSAVVNDAMKSQSSSISEYAEWLCKIEDGLTNAGWLIARVLESRRAG